MDAAENDPEGLWVISSREVYKYVIDSPQKSPSPSLIKLSNIAKKLIKEDPGLDATMDIAMENIKIHWGKNIDSLRTRMKVSYFLPYISIFGWVNYGDLNSSIDGLGRINFFEPLSSQYRGCRASHPTLCDHTGDIVKLQSSDNSNDLTYGAGILLTWPLYRTVSDGIGDNGFLIKDLVEDVWTNILWIVAQYWSERRRLLMELATSVTDEFEAVNYILRIQERTSVLNWLTDNLLGEEIYSYDFIE